MDGYECRFDQDGTPHVMVEGVAHRIGPTRGVAEVFLENGDAFHFFYDGPFSAPLCGRVRQAQVVNLPGGGSFVAGRGLDVSGLADLFRGMGVA